MLTETGYLLLASHEGHFRAILLGGLIAKAEKAAFEAIEQEDRSKLPSVNISILRRI